MEFIFEELKKICEENEFDEEDCGILVREVARQVLLADMARKEGLLSLMSYVMDEELEADDGGSLYEKYGLPKLSEDGSDASLKEFIYLIADGTDPQYTIQLGKALLCTSGLSPVEKLIHIIRLEGALNIQYGLPIRLLKKLLTAYLPVTARKLIGEE